MSVGAAWRTAIEAKKDKISMVKKRISPFEGKCKSELFFLNI